MLGRTQFVGSEFGIFGGFGWVCSSVLVGKPGFGRVRSSDLEFGELWRTLDTLFWAQNLLIFGYIWENNWTFYTIFRLQFINGRPHSLEFLGLFFWYPISVRFLTHIAIKFSGAISIYWYHRVRSSTSRVRSSAEKFCYGFGWVRSSTSRVRSSSKFDIFGFDPTLIRIGIWIA